MGTENIWANNGFGIAATGIVIVFIALTLISIFIAILPKVLKVVAVWIPEAPETPVSLTGPSPAGEDEAAAVIGYALHQIERQKTPKD